MNGFTKFIIGILVLLLVAAGIYIYVVLPHGNHVDPIVTTTDIQGTINDIGELSTAEYAYTICQVADKEHLKVLGLNIPFTSSKVMYQYNGVIKAGVQFGDIDITVNDAQMKIYVDLPKAEIFSNEPDLNSLIVYDEKYSPFNTFTFADMNMSLSELKATAEESALEQGLLDRAIENAQTILKATIGGFYDLNDYEVEFY